MTKDSAPSLVTLVLTLEIADGFPVLANCQFERHWFTGSTTGEPLKQEGNGSDQRASTWTGLFSRVCSCIKVWCLLTYLTGWFGFAGHHAPQHKTHYAFEYNI